MFAMVSLLPLMLLAALSSESTAIQPDNSTGKAFYIVFPENIAYYHPTAPVNRIYVFALHNNTKIGITHPYHQDTVNLQAGESRDYTLKAQLELNKTETSPNVLEITSNEEIIVQAVSFRSYSVQTALVIPTEKLGKKYFIPPVPTIQGSSDPATGATPLVTERGPFRLIIVNGDQANKVTVEGQNSKDLPLQPKQATQIWVQESDALRVVRAEQPVAVLFGHPCVMHSECTCSLLYTTLLPARDEKLKFFVPSAFPWESEEATSILLSETGSAKIQAFNPNSPLIEVAGTAILYRPKLLLTLIPETDFACCFVVAAIPDMKNYAVIVVHKDETDGVHVGSDPLQASQWNALKGTEYVSTKTDLPKTNTLTKNLIWHAYSKMAVYFVGHNDSTMFGNPAPVISKSSDFRGCVLRPEVIKIGDTAEGWHESLSYCQAEDMDLLSFSEAKVQEQTSKRVWEVSKGDLSEVWIGMRQSTLNAQWYWGNNDTVNITNWQKDEPSADTHRQCVLMDLKNAEGFFWRSEHCCNAFHPVCYTKPKLVK